MDRAGNLSTYSCFCLPMILADLPTSNPWVRGSNPFRRASDIKDLVDIVYSSSLLVPDGWRLVASSTSSKRSTAFLVPTWCQMPIMSTVTLMLW